MNWFELSAINPGAGAPAFSDADGARAWLAGQPQTMAARLQADLAAQMERIGVAPFTAFVQATLLEALRNAVITTQSAVRRKFAFAPRPLSSEAMAAFTLSGRVWNALGCGYLRCLEAFADEAARNPAADRQRVAIAAHRAMIACREALEDHFVAGIEVPDALWIRLQRLLQVACVLGVADVKVVDAEYPAAGETTPTDQYVLAAFLKLADPYRWSAAYYTVAHRAFMRWRNQASVAVANNDDPRMRWVPLSAVAPLPPGLGERSPAWLEVHQVRRKLRKRIEALDAGEQPEALHLGRDLNASACRDLLNSILEHLRDAYSEPREKMTPVDSECEVAAGPAGCFELLTNRPFVSNPSLGGESSRLLHERLATFGSTAELVESVERAESAAQVEGERWRLTAESVAKAELSRPAGGSGARMLPGQLVVFRDARGDTSLAIVTRAWTRLNGQTEISLRRLPGKPEAMTARAVDLLREPAFPVFVLPAVTTVGSTASLLLPTGIAPRLKKGLEARGETQLQCTLGKLIERGADFERYTFETA